MEGSRACVDPGMLPTKSGDTALLQTVLDALNVSVYLIDDGRLSYVNRKFVETIGYTREELLSLDSIDALVVEDDRAILHDVVARRRAGDLSPTRYVIRIRCRDGEALATEVHSAVAVVDGRPVVVGAAVDITTQENEARRIRERKAYFRALTENVSDLIAIIDADTRTTYVSPSVERILGYTSAELLGESQLALIHPEDRERVAEVFERLVGNEAPLASVTFRFPTKDGRWKTLEAVATNLLEHPHVRGIVMNSRDITERKRLEHDLEQMNRLTSIGRLAAQVAHEFNNVLMGIQPLVDIVRRQNDPKLARLADLVASSIGRGKRITTDILRFGRPAQPTLRPVAADELLRQVGEELRSMLPNGIEMEVSVVGEPPLVMADRAQLAQVLVNLALNARDAMERRHTGTIRLRVAACGDEPSAQRVQFSVMDSGEGIAREDLPYIFEPLFTTKRSGTGLGLSVVFQIVSLHGGHVSVDSEPGKGSTFQFVIPAAAAPAEAEEADAGAHEPAISPRVLVVEDDEVVSMGLQWALEAAGIDLFAVSHGRDVRPAVETFRPDVIVLDVNLPDTDGVTVYEQLSAHHSIPVVFSSGQAPDPRTQAMVDGRRAAYLQKPFRTDELLEAIRQLMDNEGETGGTDHPDHR